MNDRLQIEPVIARALEARRQRLREFREPYIPAALDGVRGRLEALLSANLSPGFAVHDLQPLTGGASKQHFVFDLEEPTPNGPRRRALVLRTALAECLGMPPSFQREAEVQRGRHRGERWRARLVAARLGG